MLAPNTAPPDADMEREDLMNSSLISKIEKATRYAKEPQRVQLRALEVDLRGDNDSHTVRLAGDEWSCGCDHFQVHGLCSHVMALQKLFAVHLKESLRFTQERIPAAV
jgi:hypothetical protein